MASPDSLSSSLAYLGLGADYLNPFAASAIAFGVEEEKPRRRYKKRRSGKGSRKGSRRGRRN